MPQILERSFRSIQLGIHSWVIIREKLTQRYRTVKADVKDELTIPQQTRYVVGVELGLVEREASHQVTPYVW